MGRNRALINFRFLRFIRMILKGEFILSVFDVFLDFFLFATIAFVVGCFFGFFFERCVG